MRGFCILKILISTKAIDERFDPLVKFSAFTFIFTLVVHSIVMRIFIASAGRVAWLYLAVSHE